MHFFHPNSQVFYEQVSIEILLEGTCLFRTHPCVVSWNIVNDRLMELRNRRNTMPSLSPTHKRLSVDCM